MDEVFRAWYLWWGLVSRRVRAGGGALRIRDDDSICVASRFSLHLHTQELDRIIKKRNGDMHTCARYGDDSGG